MKVYYPIFLDLASKPVVVVGGGKVGMRKIRGLAGAGAAVTVVSPVLSEALPEGVRWIGREYREGDLQGALLAYAATDRREVNRKVAGDAAVLGILLNSADAPGECGFLVPARLQHDDLQIAVSTGGTNPARAVAIRDRIAGFLSRFLSGDKA